MPRPKRSRRARFDSLWVRDANGCWIWQAAITKSGYGVFNWTGGKWGTQYRAHRAAWEIYVGPIPEGLEMDHLCRVRSCVNPQHLEPVTARENQRRSSSVSGINARKTHCVNGHEFTNSNTYRHGPDKRYRMCRSCARERQAEYRRQQGVVENA